MSFVAELTKMRRMLRDPDGTIWSDAFLRHLYNDVQNDFQHKTGVLEDLAALRVPGLYQAAYLHDWEWALLSTDQSQFYQALSPHDEGVFCHRWEPQEVAGMDADVSDYGAHFTQPWEAFMGELPGEVVRMPFPRHLNTVKFIAYDEEPIEGTTRKRIQLQDPSHIVREGEPVAFYSPDESSNDYVLYPRPATAFVNEIDGEGVALYAEGDTEDVTTGTLATRTGSFDSGEDAAIDIVEVADNVFMVFSVSPTEMRANADVSDYPGFLRKYIRYGVISRAYGGNTDGRIRSLSDFWGVRYAMGIQAVRKYLRLKRQDRDYRLMTRGEGVRRLGRHPRLPDTYPRV